MPKSIETLLNQKLQDHLSPTFLELTDESHKHAAHWPDQNPKETHWKITIESPIFEDKSRLERHQLVLSLLSDLMPPIHAISLVLRATSDKDNFRS